VGYRNHLDHGYSIVGIDLNRLCLEKIGGVSEVLEEVLE